MESRRSRGRVVKSTTPPTRIPNPPSQPVTEASEKPKVTAIRKTARPQKSEPKTTAAPKLAAGSLRRKRPRVSKPRPPNPLPQPGGPKPKFHLPTRGNFLSARSPSPTCMCGADSSASHILLLPAHRGNPPSGCPEDRHSLCGRIWQHALGGRSELNPCASPAGTRTECAGGSLNWSIFLTSTVSIFVS